jgi:hypothetical protein
MSEDERIFLSDSLKNLIDLDNLGEVYNHQETNKEFKYLNSNVNLEIKFLNNDVKYSLNVFEFKKNKKFIFTIEDAKEDLIINFLQCKIESINMFLNKNQYIQSFDKDNYKILYSIQYNIKDNYKLIIKIKKVRKKHE